MTPPPCSGAGNSRWSSRSTIDASVRRWMTGGGELPELCDGWPLEEGLVMIAERTTQHGISSGRGLRPRFVADVASARREFSRRLRDVVVDPRDIQASLGRGHRGRVSHVGWARRRKRARSIGFASTRHASGGLREASPCGERCCRGAARRPFRCLGRSVPTSKAAGGGGGRGGGGCG